MSSTKIVAKTDAHFLAFLAAQKAAQATAVKFPPQSPAVPASTKKVPVKSPVKKS